MTDTVITLWQNAGVLAGERPPLRPGETMRFDAWDFAHLSAAQREVIYLTVLALGMEAWTEGGDVVFSRPSLPPTNKASHAKRHLWVKG